MVEGRKEQGGGDGGPLPRHTCPHLPIPNNVEGREEGGEGGYLTVTLPDICRRGGVVVPVVGHTHMTGQADA